MFEHYVCVFVENVGGASGASHQDVAVFNPPTEFRPHFHVAGLRWIRAETCPDTSEVRFRIDDAQKVCLILLLFHTILSRRTIHKLPIGFSTSTTPSFLNRSPHLRRHFPQYPSCSMRRSQVPPLASPPRACWAGQGLTVSHVDIARFDPKQCQDLDKK